MDSHRFSQIAKWLLAVFASMLLLSLLGLVLRTGEEFVLGIAYSVFLACWLSMPAALAALFVTASTRIWTSSVYLTAQVTVFVSSAWLLPPAFLIPDAQNGIALVLLPIFQAGAVLVCAGVVWLVQALTTRSRT